HLADFAGHDIGQWRAAIRRLPYQRSHFVEGEKSRVHRRHNHHFAADEAGGDGRTARDVFFCDQVLSSIAARAGTPKSTHSRYIIMSQTRLSGTNVNRRTGTCSTNSHADRKTRFTNSVSSAKKRTFLNSNRVASAAATFSIRFSTPCCNRKSVLNGADRFSPSLANSPAKGVPQARYLSPSRRT